MVQETKKKTREGETKKNEKKKKNSVFPPFT